MESNLFTPWPLIVAIVSAVAAFVFNMAQKRIDFQQRRRSIAVAIYVEILHAKEGATSLYVNWEAFRNDVKDDSFKPLLVVSSDIRVLERVHIEDLNFPQAVVSAVTRFHNSIRELYECLNAINSERFCLIRAEGRLRLVTMGISIASEVEKRATIAIEAMQSELPKKWFRNLR